MYTDDFEIVNPIRSHRKKHKIMAFYWMLKIFPAKYKSRLSAIQLVALAKTAVVKKFGSRVKHLRTSVMDSISRTLIWNWIFVDVVSETV